MSNSYFTSAPYTVQPSDNPTLAAGYVHCTVVYDDLPPTLADGNAMLAIRANGKIDVISRRHCFTPVCQHFAAKSVALGGYVPFLIDEGYPVIRLADDELELDKSGDYAEPAWGMRYVQVGVSRRAWALASLFAVDVIEGRWKAGPEPTPTPPMPPLVDIRFPVAVPAAEVAVG